MIKVAVLNWTNAGPQALASGERPFPFNILDADPGGPPPFYGIGVVDWRLDGPLVGVTVAFNHLNDCDRAEDFPEWLRTRWDSLPVDPDGRTVARYMGPTPSIDLIRDETPEAGRFCTTVVTTEGFQIGEPGQRDVRNLAFQNAFHLFQGIIHTSEFFAPQAD